MTDAQAAEQEFYSHYSWCLNPALTVADLFQRLCEELDRYPTLSGWQREESKANLYLFVCAVACTADDYLGLRWIDLKPVSKRVPKLRPLLASVQPVFDAVECAAKGGDAGVRRWRRVWNEAVEIVCRAIVAERANEAKHWMRLRSIASGAANTRLPQALLKRRMRLPEAFRAQDMAHFDVLTLIQRYCDSNPKKDEPIVIIGLRTAGAYFAPLMTEYLKSQGFSTVSWFSIRPKNGTGRFEARQLKAAARDRKRILLVDDYPSTGYTFRITFDLLNGFGIRSEQIAVLAPTHTAQPKWAQLAKIRPPIQVFTIHPDDLYKMSILNRAGVARLCSEYFGADGSKARVVDDPSIGTINRRLAEHSKDGHHVRDKRVFSIDFERDGQPAAGKRILFKSVGWGWLGYHAYFAGTRLDGFVPKVIGLRNGLLLSEWVEQTPPPAEVKDTMVNRVASYVAARSRRLPLPGDCRFERRTYRWTGCDDILNILRSAYGPYVNRLKLPALRKQLQKVVTSVPTLVDGRMNPEEWLHSAGGIFKTDFEHHNFGGGEFDIVDPAFDLAAAMFEFGFSKLEQQELLRRYIEESGDSTVEQRILLHKILCGTVAMQRATNAAIAGKDPLRNNERRTRARNFLVYSMSEFCAQFVRQPMQSLSWTQLLFFLDIDGVFDQELLGFPHATRRALEAIALLRAYDFTIVLNTGRGINDVRQYCEAYDFPGGVAEFGSVFFDAIRQREIPLIGGAGAEELAACRETIQQLPGVFLDSNYRFAIRLYRYKNGTTSGLSPEEVRAVLKSSGFSKLAYISRDADTYIVQRRTGKGAALRSVRRMVGSPDIPVTAIGDSKQDISMLAAADISYATGNCSPLLRKLSRQGNCRVVKQGYQSGLLAAVKHRVRQEGRRVAPELPHREGLIETLLQAADRGVIPQAVSALMWWST